MKKNLLIFLLTISCGVLMAQHSIGMIGPATPFGWDADTNMVQRDSVTWELDIFLTDGEAKFRENDDWTRSWGGVDFPTDTAILNSFDNIPVIAGQYHVELDTAVPEYRFELMSPMGIIGSATPNGWDSDINMYPDQSNPNAWFIVLDLVAGECKFRLDDDWTDNWGGGNFPMDTAEYNSAGNIVVDQAGEYFITFDTATLIYEFRENVNFQSIGLIGSATPSGWDADTNMVKDANDPNLYQLDIDLIDGEVKFRANDDWADNWGGTDFPSGIAVSNSPDNIPVTAGRYRVSFNVETLEYSFTELIDYATVGIVGTAVNGDFTTISAMDKLSAEDYSVRMDLSSGDLLFVANEDLAINWGGGDFPSGVAERNGALVPVAEGDYIITFNSVSGAYNFELVVEFDAMALVGKSGPFGEWPSDGDMGAVDLFLEKDSENVNAWSYSGVELGNFADVEDGGVKFRADTAWTNNWGAAEFPAGVGVANGPNIEPVAGTYDIAFNDVSGEYIFSESSATRDLIKPEAILLFPNPADEQITIDLSVLEVTGEMDITLSDFQGKPIRQTLHEAAPQVTLHTADLGAGMYIVTIRSENFLLSKKFMVK